MPQLRIIEGAGTGSSCPIIGAVLTLGRDTGNLLLIDDPKASRYHAEIAAEGGQWILRDLGSSNGTWQGEQRITTLTLTEGATFRIGRVVLCFDLAANRSSTAERTEFHDPTRLTGLTASETDLFRKRMPIIGGNTTAELARQNAYLVLLHRIVEHSRAARTRDELFEVLDDNASELLEGDRVAVFLPGGHNPELGGWALWPAHELRLRARFGAIPFARTLLETVRDQREPLLCTREGDLDPSVSMERAGVRSAMAAPLRIGPEVQALIYVDRISGVAPFTRPDLEFLAAVANQLAVCLANHEQVAELKAEVARLARPAQALPVLIGETIRPLVETATRVASGTLPVLITGDPGTGKDVFARLVHGSSPRATQPLQVLSCVGEDPQRLERLLCGRIGDPRPGLLELAHQGTLLVEEIGDLPAGAQARLLRAIASNELQRMDDATVRPVDVRLIATSTRSLATLALRPDLLETLRTAAIELPALGARGADIEPLCEHILGECARRLDQTPKRLAPETKTALLRADWPGNVRQLKQVLERATALTPDLVIRPQDLPESLRAPPATTPTQGAFAPVPLADIERTHILRTLDHCGGNKKACAEILEIDRSTLYAKLRQYGVH